MQELKITSWCDVCNAESGAKVEALVSFVAIVTPLNPQGRPVKPKRLDLCDNHSKPVADVVEMLKVGTVYSPKAEEPKPPPVPKPRPEPAPEPAEPKPVTRPASPSSDSGKSKAAVRAARWGRQRTLCPICERDVAKSSLITHIEGKHKAPPLVHPKKCPDCGERYNLAQSMQTHRRRTHGWDHIAETVKRAKR